MRVVPHPDLTCLPKFLGVRINHPDCECLGFKDPSANHSTALSGKGTGEGEVTGTMAFDRKEYGMNGGIPFIKIADRGEVNVHLKGKRVSGPPLVFKQ
jgi:hypothetical protein